MLFGGLIAKTRFMSNDEVGGALSERDRQEIMVMLEEAEKYILSVYGRALGNIKRGMDETLEREDMDVSGTREILESFANELDRIATESMGLQKELLGTLAPLGDKEINDKFQNIQNEMASKTKELWEEISSATLKVSGSPLKESTSLPLFSQKDKGGSGLSDYGSHNSIRG